MDAQFFWLVSLLLAAVVLLVAELFVPSAGVLSILGGACLLGAIVLGMLIDRRLGAGLVAAVVLLSPFAVTLGLKLWQKTPVGRRLVLDEIVPGVPPQEVLVGSTGTAVTDLRPMGECEIGQTRFTALAESGQIISAGTMLKVLAFTDGVALVRPTTKPI